MINSATALKLLKRENICQPIRETDKGAIGYGILVADLKRWLARRGFRVDTARSTFVRWTETWTYCGDIIPIKNNVGAVFGYWFNEVPTNLAVMTAAIGDPENLQCIYALNLGIADPKICESLGISLGGSA